jgi:hypothetical protein
VVESKKMREKSKKKKKIVRAKNLKEFRLCIEKVTIFIPHAADFDIVSLSSSLLSFFLISDIATCSRIKKGMHVQVN